MSGPETQPVQIHIARSTHLEIVWADAHKSMIPLVELRKACPCAGCREAREERKRNPLAVVKAVQDQESMAVVDKAEVAGNYALWIRWKDGHDTGFYDFALLLALG